MSDPRWTPARVAAMQVFAADEHLCARESNVTDGARGVVYWQSIQWLEATGLIKRIEPRGCIYQLTDAGVAWWQRRRDAGEWVCDTCIPGPNDVPLPFGGDR